MSTQPLAGLGEFELIERIMSRLGSVAARDILVPPGDDAAAWLVPAGAVVATTDALVEGVHWRSGEHATMGWADVGWRAVASNVSDIAAMGATPQHVLVVLTVGPALDLEALDALIDGVSEACTAHEVHVAGGDIVRGGETSVSMTVIGSATADASGEGGDVPLLRRDRAREGDVVAVSGWPGASGAGLALIEAGRADEPEHAALVAAHRRPHARVALGRAALAAGVRCGIDVSDGVLQDAGHIAERSGVGVEIDLEALPVHPRAVAALGVDGARDLALGGGEDYELVLVGTEDALRALDTPEVPVTLIGRVVAAHPGDAWALDATGARYVPTRAGWDQLRS
jgi:thiamine-monophosphate kinase